MESLARQLLLVAAIGSLAWHASAQCLGGSGPPCRNLSNSLFSLREIDLHLHSGMERPVDLKRWVDLAVADGRRVLLLLDHLELYRKTPEQYAAWRAGRNFEAHYPLGPAGHNALFADFEGVMSRKDVLVFRGWEISEDELDSGVEAVPMRMADAIGWHISPRNGSEPPNGAALIRRVKQIREIQKQFPVPMILFHPFPMRVENIRRAAAAKHRDLRTISASEYRFFHGNEQEELIRLLKGTSIYLEISHATDQYFSDPAVREAMIADMLPLVKAGLQFTVSTDNHHLKAANTPFDPDRYCAPLGITPQNTNAIVRELLALRARRAILAAAPPGSARGFEPLFNGKNLDGWVQDTPGIWSVRDGMIVGKSSGLKHNEFLRTRKTYKDFTLKLSFRLVNGSGNSGIQFRSRPVPNSHEVSGYQADIGETYWGCLYDESRRRKVLVQASPASLAGLYEDGWNDYVISAKGNHITLDLNGFRTVEYLEPEHGMDVPGLIALQVHGGPGLEVQFKNIRIREY
jgi:hypothetical protein